MIRVFFTYIAFINIILSLKYASTENATTTALLTTESPDGLLFKRFKESYNRVYPNIKSELNGYENFKNNLAEVNELNRAHKGNIIVYQLNRYADLNRDEISERFGIQIKPYDNMEHENKEAVMREHRHKFLEDMKLYDLGQVDDLYTAWAKKWKKSALKKKKNDLIRYYRFIKTVAEANKQKFAGYDVSLDQDADKVREPNQFFYGK